MRAERVYWTPGRRPPLSKKAKAIAAKRRRNKRAIIDTKRRLERLYRDGERLAKAYFREL